MCFSVECAFPDIKDRGDAAILVMALMQDLFANAPPIYSTEEELGVDKLDIKESRWNGVKVLGEVLVEAQEPSLHC